MPSINYNQTEVWRPISGHLLYQASSLGRIRSYRGRNGTVRKNPIILKQFKGANGYWTVKPVITGSNKKILRYVHKLVLLAFVGNKPDSVIRHLNGDKNINHLSNLSYGTRKENEADKILHGTKAEGEKNGRSKLRNFQVEEIKDKLSMGDSVKSISIAMGLPEHFIYGIKSGRTYKSVGS